MLLYNLVQSVKVYLVTSGVLYLHVHVYSSFCSEEAQEYVEIGSLNGLFVLGRTMGFIGKFCHPVASISIIDSVGAFFRCSAISPTMQFAYASFCLGV